MAQHQAVDPEHERAGAERWLVTFLGLRPRSLRYELDGQEEEAQHAGLALLALLRGPRAPSTVRVLATPESKADTWPQLEAAFAKYQRSVDIVELGAVDDLDSFLRTLVDMVACRRGTGPVELLLDLTHGYRHLPMLTYAGLLYLAALHPEVHVAQCWYSMELADEGRARFVDLLPLLELPEWLHALRLLDEREDATMLAALLGDGLKHHFDREGKAHAGRDERKLLQELEQFASTLAWHCPLDVALTARALASSKRINRALKLAEVPGANGLATRLGELVGSYALAAPVEGSPKRKPRVSEETLPLHARMVDAAFARNDLPAAAALLREWLVSWAWLTEHRRDEPNGDSLSRQSRQEAERLLGALAAYQDDWRLRKLLSDDQQHVGAFWRQLGEVRNALAHLGMRPEPTIDVKEKAEELHHEWTKYVKTLQDSDDVVLRPQGREGVLLVSPLGRSPGVLTAALDLCEPVAERLLVVTSVECRDQVLALTADKVPEDAVTILTFEDPRGGLEEVKGLVQRARLPLAQAVETRVNLTGGTTLIGLAVERIAQAAKRLETPVRRFVLLEPREDEGTSRLLWVDDPAGN